MPSSAVIVVTMCRPDFVRTCLTHLKGQTLSPTETIVVDASPDDRTDQLVRQEFPEVLYLRNPLGNGTMATSRQIGFRASSSDVVAYLDDDAFAAPDWLANLLDPYEDPQVGAVGGRVLRGEPPEYHAGLEIGRMRPDSTLTGNFDADPGRPIVVEHIQGANMSYRRSVLLTLGGIRDGYPGTCLREESDLCCRVRALGRSIVFTPHAVVDHVAAPYVKGRRFDLRYDYFGQRNHLVFLVRNFGYRSPLIRRFLGVTAANSARSARQLAERHHQGEHAGALARAGGRIGLRALAQAAGTVTGCFAGLVERQRDRASGRPF